MAKQPRGAQASAIRKWTYERLIAPQLARQLTERLRTSEYRDLHDQRLATPAGADDAPDRASLEYAWDRSAVDLDA